MGVNEELQRDQARVRAYDDEAEIKRLRARVTELERERAETREQLRLAHIDALGAEAEANDFRADVERLTRELDEARDLLRAVLDEACCLSALDDTCRQIKRPRDEWCAICRARDAMEGEP